LELRLRFQIVGFYTQAKQRPKLNWLGLKQGAYQNLAIELLLGQIWVGLLATLSGRFGFVKWNQ
jgi:hypothetical protein